MKHNFRILLLSILCLLSLSVSQLAYGKKIHSKEYKYKISIPNTMQVVEDTSGADGAEQLYFDTSHDVVLIISARTSNFRSVNDYIDCSNHELEQRLQTAFGDSSVKLISCARSRYYPGKSAVVHFYVTDDANGLNTYVVYFIHKKKKDLQLSFTYQKDSEQESIAFVDGIMQTLKLK